MNEDGRYFQLQGKAEVEMLLRGLEAIGEKNAVAEALKKRLGAAQRYFRTLETNTAIKTAARKRDIQRRRDGRG